jgi:protein gp37
MAENSKIEWCDHTVNLWWGCSKVHTGCKNCYAEYFSDTRYKKNLWGEKQPRQRIKSAFNDLDKYQKQAESQNKLLKIFCGSMMDIFEDSKLLTNPTEEFETTSDLRFRLFHKIGKGEYNNLVFLFLTKRPENIALNAPTSWITNAPKNVWFGTSISNQETADKFTNILSCYKANNLFLSVEPQVDFIELNNKISPFSWIIQGGESGHNKREFNIEWARSLRNECQDAKIPYFFKQIDKIKEIPTDLMIREFPIMQVGSACP